MADDLLRLKWNLHDSTFLEICKVQRSRADYSDVTLTAQGKFFKAHKLVLGHCSEYFKEIFEHTSDVSPVIVLQDISIQILEYILDYMYIGEVNIHQEQLNFLLRAAEALKIRGLASTQPELYNDTKENNPSSSTDEPPRKRGRSDMTKNIASSNMFPNQSMGHSSLDDDPLVPIIKMEQTDENTPLVIDQSSMPILSNSNAFASSTNPGHLQIPVGQESEDHDTPVNGERSTGLVSGTGRPLSKEAPCDRCSMVLANQNLLRRHIEDHHLHIRKYYCSHCSKSFKRKEHKERHERIHTGEKPFGCNFCSSRFTQKEHLKGHVENVHMKKSNTDIRLQKKSIKPNDRPDTESSVPSLAPATSLSAWSNDEYVQNSGQMTNSASSPDTENQSVEPSQNDNVTSAIYAPLNRRTADSPTKQLQTLNFKFP